MMKPHVRLIDQLVKEQDRLLSIHRKTKNKKLRDKLSLQIEALGEQINTIFNAALELEKHGKSEPIFNKDGKCYHCGEAIDLENGRCIIYESHRNGTISLFHEEHFNNPPVVGMHKPVAIIGFSVASDSKRMSEK